MKLYKYVCADRIDILLNGLIRFSQPEVWNDPFDCYPSYEDHKEKNPFYIMHKMANLINRAQQGDIPTPKEVEEYETERKRLTKDDVYRYINRKIVSLSLTEKKDDLLMWSHYANHHGGFVIEFDTDTDFFNRPGTHLFKIKYSNKRPSVKTIEFAGFVVSLVERLERNEALSLECIENTPSLFCKSIDWEYEKEWRLITTNDKAHNFDEFKDRLSIIQIGEYEQREHYKALYPIPISSITAIYCGERMSCEKVRKLYLLTKHNPIYSHIKLMYSTMDDTEYILKDREITGHDVFSIGELQMEGGNPKYTRKCDPFHVKYRNDVKRYKTLKPITHPQK